MTRNSFEFIAIVNYGIIGLIQLELGYAESADISIEEALALYDKYVKEALELMLAKNHDYDGHGAVCVSALTQT